MPNSLSLVCPDCDTINRVPANKLGAGPKCGKCQSAILSGKVVDLSAKNFQKVIARHAQPVVVDFWASWCGPCKMMVPVFSQVAQQLCTEARFARVNTETEQALVGQFGIRSIPTLIMFRNGQERSRKSGALNAASLANWVRGYL